MVLASTELLRGRKGADRRRDGEEKNCVSGVVEMSPTGRRIDNVILRGRYLLSGYAIRSIPVQ